MTVFILSEALAAKHCLQERRLALTMVETEVCIHMYLLYITLFFFISSYIHKHTHIKSLIAQNIYMT